MHHHIFVLMDSNSFDFCDLGLEKQILNPKIEFQFEGLQPIIWSGD